MIIIINKKVQIYSYTEHYNIQIIIIIYMNGISINHWCVGGMGSVGNMYKIIIIQQQLALNSRANCPDMMFHTINSLSHLLLLIKKQLSQMKEHLTIVS